MSLFRQSRYWVHSTTQRDLEQFESVLLEWGGCRDDLHGVVVHHDSVLSNGGQVRNQSLKAVNGLSVVSSFGMDFLKSLEGTPGGSHDGFAKGLCSGSVMIIK